MIQQETARELFKCMIKIASAKRQVEKLLLQIADDEVRLVDLNIKATQEAADGKIPVFTSEQPREITFTRPLFLVDGEDDL